MPATPAGGGESGLSEPSTLRPRRRMCESPAALRDDETARGQHRQSDTACGADAGVAPVEAAARRRLNEHHRVVAGRRVGRRKLRRGRGGGGGGGAERQGDGDCGLCSTAARGHDEPPGLPIAHCDRIGPNALAERWKSGWRSVGGGSLTTIGGLLHAVVALSRGPQRSCSSSAFWGPWKWST